MKATHISWDTDGENAADLGLPIEMHIPDEILRNGEDAITDYLSDQTGWLVESWSGPDAETQEEIEQIRRAAEGIVAAFDE